MSLVTYEVLSNKKNRSVTLLVSNTSTIELIGNTETSDVALSGEEVYGASLYKAQWGINKGGSIQVARGANLVAVYDSTNFHDYSGGMVITNDSQASLNVTFINVESGFLLLELRKYTDIIPIPNPPDPEPGDNYITFGGEYLTFDNEILTLG